MRYIDTDYSTEIRFDIPKFVDMNEDVFDTVDSYIFEKVDKVFKEQINVRDLSVVGVFTVTTQEYRPDIISAEIYEGDTQYWWLLMEFNSMIDVFQMVSGVRVNYFDLNRLEDIYFALNSKQKQQDR